MRNQKGLSRRKMLTLSEHLYFRNKINKNREETVETKYIGLLLFFFNFVKEYLKTGKEYVCYKHTL